MLAASSTHTITWEKLPDDFVLPDDPVDNIGQPAIAAALTESLQRAETERQRAEAQRQRAERLAAQLRSAGIEPEE